MTSRNNILERSSVLIIERFSEDDADAKDDANGVVCAFMDVPRHFPRHFHVVFDVGVVLLKLSNNNDNSNMEWEWEHVVLSWKKE